MNVLDHHQIDGLSYVSDMLKKFGCKSVLIKKLTKNNNDKQQVYFHHNPDLLNSIFDLTFGYRVASISKKNSLVSGKMIPEAVFNNFFWVSVDSEPFRVSGCKGILYAQYPEVRLSGFQSDSGVMPSSMSISFAKGKPEIARYLAIGADDEGRAYALMIVQPKNQFAGEFRSLPLYENSKICRLLSITQPQSASDKLKIALKNKIAGKDIKGCRLTADGRTIPFTGPQVHGYTLEHELGIATNAGKDGDFLGIELKCYTNSKLTLFTPEPDGGLYADSFDQFMIRYGYCKEAVYRFTGIHRAGNISEKSNLTLEVLCENPHSETGTLIDFDPDKPFGKQLKSLQVVLRDTEGAIAASWSLARLLNNWGVKHNEVVYVPAQVKDNHIQEESTEGFTKRVWFGNEFLWCRRTSLERMIRAIASGVIFLDPAPKYEPENPRHNKRRSQWRINNIHRDSASLYESVENVIL